LQTIVEVVEATRTVGGETGTTSFTLLGRTTVATGETIVEGHLGHILDQIAGNERVIIREHLRTIGPETTDSSHLARAMGITADKDTDFILEGTNGDMIKLEGLPLPTAAGLNWICLGGLNQYSIQ